MAKLNEISPPPGAYEDAKSHELLRAWVANGGLHCSLDVGAWDDENVLIGWGILLSDVARHVADALAKGGKNREMCLREMQKVFNDELDAPTAETSGSFVE
jgi:hypothetical protein